METPRPDMGTPRTDMETARTGMESVRHKHVDWMDRYGDCEDRLIQALPVCERK